MSSEDDLCKVITEELRVDGHLNKLQSEVRSKVLKLLSQRWGVSLSSKASDPPIKIFQLNQVIKEYLEWMGYAYSSSIFTAESGVMEDKSNVCLGLKKQFGLQEKKDEPFLLNLFLSIEPTLNKNN